MNLSTDELFHFTKFDYLKSIIESKSFLPRFSLEFCHLSKAFQYKATLLPIAMVCFCDIPLEQSKKHRERYRNHGIVLTEKWKLNKGLNPVFYVQSESFLANIFANFTSMTSEFKPIINSKNYGNHIPMMLSKIGHNLTYLSYFIKQFENKNEIPIKYEEKNIGILEKRRFYDEKEWRYIPFQADNKNELHIEISDFLNPETLRIANKKLENYKLTFEFEDIKYLIVNNEMEKQELKTLIYKKFQKEIEVKIVD